MKLQEIINHYKDRILDEGLIVLVEDVASDTGELQVSMLYRFQNHDGDYGIGHSYPPGYCSMVYPIQTNFRVLAVNTSIFRLYVDYGQAFKNLFDKEA